MAATNTYSTAIITEIREELADVKTFALTYEDGSAIPYSSGQFVTLAFVHHEREERRSYSISSCAELGEQLSFTVKRIDNGAYSRLLTDRARVGDKLFTTGAAGLFTLPVTIGDYRQVFFFAAGIGITPILPLIKSLLYSRAATQAVLIYSNRSQADTVFYKELKDLESEFPQRLRIEFLYSTSFNLARARLSKALVPVLMREYATVTHDKLLCFVCGPFTYMRMAIYSLEEHGVKDAHIRKENFNTNDRDVPRAIPPDTALHKVTIKHNREEHTFTTQYPETILQAAKRNGLLLPYSCEVGRCGSCAARCTQGRVWLSYNEVLMDTDLKQGSILTCTGYAVGGDVVIEV